MPKQILFCLQADLRCEFRLRKTALFGFGKIFRNLFYVKFLTKRGITVYNYRCALCAFYARVCIFKVIYVKKLFG